MLHRLARLGSKGYKQSLANHKLRFDQKLVRPCGLLDIRLWVCAANIWNGPVGALSERFSTVAQLGPARDNMIHASGEGRLGCDEQT